MSTINKHLQKWRNIKTYLEDLRLSENDDVIWTINQAKVDDGSDKDNSDICWKNIQREVSKIVKVLEKLGRQYEQKKSLGRVFGK